MILLDKAMQYANDVVDGKEVTTFEVKKQCEWFLRDLELQYDDEFRFYLDNKELKKINNLLKLFNLATGFSAGKPVLNELWGFQAFLIVNVFGWRFKDNRKKFRYKDITLFIARKNAKSFISALILILLMLTEQDYSEFYSICLNRDLAGEIRKAIIQILNVSPAVAKYFELPKTLASRSVCKLTNSFYMARTSEANSNNSIRPACIICDEAGAMTSKANIKAMQSGQLSVINPLIFKLTTAYAIDGSVMESELDYLKKIYTEQIKNKVSERVFALLYYAEEEHLWDDIGLQQANPMRIKENYDEIKEVRAMALEKGGEDEEEYLTKNMNHFLPSVVTSTYVDIKDVKKCELKEDFSLEGKTVYMSLDLSQSDDNTSVTVSYEEDEEIYTKSWAFIPKNKIALKSRREKISYANFIKQGICFACGENSIDYTFVKNFILDFEEKYKCEVEMIGYDIRDCKLFAKELEFEGMNTVEIRQHSSVLHAPTKYLKELIENNKWHYYDNKLLEINLTNARCREDTNLNKYVTKKHSAGKIDMVVGTIMTVSLLQNDDSWDSM